MRYALVAYQSLMRGKYLSSKDTAYLEISLQTTFVNIE